MKPRGCPSFPSFARHGHWIVRPFFFRSIESLLSLLVVAGIGSTVGVAVEASPFGDRDEAEWGEPSWVLTPARLPQRLDEAPNAMTVIDRAMIEASGARRVEEVLRLVPGFQVGHKYNNQPTIAYHGLSDEFARRVLVLINGQRIFQYSGGGVDWNNLPIPLQDIERIEVIRGPSAAAYGSNALTAVINVQTGVPAEYAGWMAQAAAGNNRVADGFFRWGGRAGAFDVALSLASTGEGGYPTIHDDRRNNLLLVQGELPLGNAGELRLLAGYGRGDYEAQNVNAAYPGTFERDFVDTNQFQSLQWRRTFTPDEELRITLSRNRIHHGDPGFSSAAVIPGVTLKIDFQFEEKREEFQLDYARRFSDRWRMVAGLGYYRDAYRSPYYLNTDATIATHVVQLFGHGEYRPWEHMVFNLGAMLERAPLSDEWLVLPRLSAHWHLDDHQTLRAIYASGSRQPSIYENQGQAVIRGVNVPLTIYRVDATGIERGGLAPERNRALELGYFWQPAPSINLDLRVFQERISDFITAFNRVETTYPTAQSGNTVVDFGNENPIILRGAEAQLQWRNRHGTRLFAGYAWLDADADAPLFDGDYTHGVPRHGASLLLSQEWPEDWRTSLAYTYQSALRWYREASIDATHQLTGRLAKRLRWGNTQALAELIGGNLMGDVSDYLPGRAWERGVFFRFSLHY